MGTLYRHGSPRWGHVDLSLYDRRTMPWCEGCARFLNPNTLTPDGSCPSCGRKVAEQPGPKTEPKASTSSAVQETQETVTAADLGLGQLPESETEVPKAPWHFKLLVVLAVFYLAWRFVEMAGTLAG